MSEPLALLISTDVTTGALVERVGSSIPGYHFASVTSWGAARPLLDSGRVHLIIVSEDIEAQDRDDPIWKTRDRYPLIPLVLLATGHSDRQIVEAMRRGFFDCLQLPLSVEKLEDVTTRASAWRKKLEVLIRQSAGRQTDKLERRLSALEAIERVGRKVTSLLDLDSVLTSVVDAAVELTGAEEGSLLLLDEATGELYMRASKNFQQEFASTFRLPIRNSLVGQALRSGKPLIIDQETPQKIKTAYLVHTLIYVPMIIQDRAIGVLEVDHRRPRRSFSEQHVTLMQALADYAAIAIENARLYSHSEYERNKLETILTEIDEGVIIVDNDRRVVLINRKACQAFGVTDPVVAGKRLREVISHQELIETLQDPNLSGPSQIELTLKDGRVLNTQLTPLRDIGIVVTMQDITHLKELDRIKSDFVHTVSHDLRSPLTAILGYVELIDRVGPVNDQQREFIRRVQVSVHNITTLINDLLDLGRIEAGFDVRKELIPFSAIMHYTVDGVRARSQEKHQELVVDVPEDLPEVLGNPIRLRQMFNNLVTNAIKYTPENGRVEIFARAQTGQIILQVKDNGPGIPPSDQPYIFDKFYRASNVPLETPGTGLGLAIVKSIVDNHLGRIWFASTLGEGTTFTVILPTAGRSLAE